MRKMTIEAAIRWAYQDELPKVGGVLAALSGPGFKGSAARAVEKSGRQGGLVDDAGLNMYGLSPFDVWLGGPHEDALVIGNAVNALPDRIEAWADATDLVADLGEDVLLGMALGRAAVRCGRIDMPRLMRKCALFGAPDWYADPVERVCERHPNGEERWFAMVDRAQTTIDGREVLTRFEVDARIGRKKGLLPGAYRKFHLDPDPTEAIEQRIRYVAWTMALGALQQALVPCLAEIDLLPCDRAIYPWLNGPSQSITWQVSGWVVPPVERFIMGPRARRPRAGEMRHIETSAEPLDNGTLLA